MSESINITCVALGLAKARATREFLPLGIKLSLIRVSILHSRPNFEAKTTNFRKLVKVGSEICPP
tara:strand:- start:871 stop:1065 length:195 start_codon:yes stop_codon:yes gene_type:complete